MFRYNVINNCFNTDNKIYLEIGICSGETYSNVKYKFKDGVDPYPNHHGVKYTNFKMTSDEFFNNHCNKKYDIIFIDGLHHSEQVVKDFNNSINFLNDNSYIIFDDIYPKNKTMQVIPRPEKGQPAGPGTPWTGDCWKCLLNILDNVSDDKYELKIYTSENYFGVATLLIKKQFNIINFNYDFDSDFDRYINKLNMLL